MARLAAVFFVFFVFATLTAPVFSVEPYSVEFHISTPGKGPGIFIIDVNPDWAPIGAAHFKELVELKFYDNSRFFRVIPNFMAQFGIAGDPALSAEWSTKDIKDDTVKESNKRGYVSFAQTSQPNSRSTQLFINFKDNSFLDGQRFAPFAKVREPGMTIVDSIFQIGEQPDQFSVQQDGNAYMDANFPAATKILRAFVKTEHGNTATGESHSGTRVITG